MNRRQANHYSLSTCLFVPHATQETAVVSIVYQFHPSLIYLQEQSSGVFHQGQTPGQNHLRSVICHLRASCGWRYLDNESKYEFFQLLFHFIKYQISRRP